MKSKHFFRDLLLCGLAGAAAAGCAFIPVPVLPQLLAVVLLYGAGSAGLWQGAALAAVCHGGILYAVLGLSAVPDAVFGAVLAVGAWLVMRRAKRAFDALCGACAVVLLALWAVTLTGAALFGTEVIDALFIVDEAVLAAMRDSYAVMGYTPVEAAMLTAEFAASYGETAPAIMLVFSMLCGVLGYGIGTRVGKGSLHFTPPPFAQWYMPNGHLLAGFVLLAVSFLLRELGSPLGMPAMLAVELFIVTAYSLQGAAVVWFMTSRSRLSAPLKYIVFIAAALVLLGFGLLFLAVMDNITNSRRRAMK